jgi:hypothetical protein
VPYASFTNKCQREKLCYSDSSLCDEREEGRFVWGGCGKDEATSLRPRQTESSLEFMTVGVMWLVTQ